MGELRRLRCTLTRDERVAKADAWAGVQRRLEALRAESKARAVQTREDIKELESSAAQLCREVSDSAEFRDVEVREELDFKGGVVQVYREDNGELVESRPMTLAERQLFLPAEMKVKRGD